MKKIKISAFEFAIMSVADPEGAKNYYPETEEERQQKRIDDLQRQASKLKIITPCKKTQ